MDVFSFFEKVIFSKVYLLWLYFGNREKFVYPATQAESEYWLIQFFENSSSEFGDFEDAIVGNENILNHSVISPLLNFGLLLPVQVVESALNFAREKPVSMNSLEGSIRQIIGWREFIRGVYVFKGTQERNSNFWKFSNKVPSSFYYATTGILPVDNTLRKVPDTAYCHLLSG